MRNHTFIIAIACLAPCTPAMASPMPGGGNGACCFMGQCVEMVQQEECVLSGGDYLGDDVACLPGLCNCAISTGDCFQEHMQRGCNNVDCCILVCTPDPQCCEIAWDLSCANAAQTLCEYACCTETDCLDGINYLDCVAMEGQVVYGTCTPELCTSGACCFEGPPGADCLIVSEDECATLPGGVFLGLGTTCPQTQTIVVPIHDGPPDEWSHEIVIVTGCPGEGTGPDCVEGPYHIDPWETAQSTGTTNCENFGAPTSCPIPAGFFGPGSDPFAGQICFQGAPLGPVILPGLDGPLDFAAADTLIRRSNDPFDRCELPNGDPVEVEITMERLHLVSIDPITVTYGGGASELWDVRVEVNSSDGQPGGVLTAFKTHCNGGFFDSTIAACPTFIFTRVSDGTEIDLQYCDTCNPGGIVMVSNGIPWVHDPEPGLGVISPVCSQFFPSIEQFDKKSDCDCNGNQVRDLCDVEQLNSKDCNANLIPDECEPDGCPADVNCDGLVSVPDLTAVILQWDCMNPPGPCLADVNGDGAVNVSDLTDIILNWGPCN